MKAAVVPKIGGKWEVREVPTPEPLANQVLIKIRASGLCYTDVHITEGHLPIPIEFPRTIGYEPVGEIVALGEGVTSRKVGERVGVPWVQASCGRCEWCLRGKPMFCAQHNVLCATNWHRYWYLRRPRRVYGGIRRCNSTFTGWLGL